MKRMFLLLFLISLLSLPVLAADKTGSDTLLQEQIEQSGADSLGSSLPSQAEESLGNMGISGPDPDGLVKFTPSSLLKEAVGMLKNEVESPIKAVASVFGILLACALLNTLKSSFGEKPLKQVFDTVCALCIAAVVLTPVSKCIASAGTAVSEAGKFSLAFIPVFAGLVTASGHPASAAVFQGLMLAASQVIVKIAATTFVPMVGAYLALCVVGAVSPGIHISGITGFIKKLVSWGLGLCVTVFVAILTVQGLITGAADTVSVKAAKFMVGSLVPVIGSAVSDAVNTVVSCANLLKTATGAYAILVFVLAFLPPILECLLWMLAVDLSVAAAEILSIDQMTGMLKSIKDALGIMMALVLTAALTLIVSTSVMLLLGMNN